MSGIVMGNFNRNRLFKAKTCKAEGFDCLFRRFLVWLGRKMKRHSNSNIVRQYPVSLLMLKWNNRRKTILFFPTNSEKGLFHETKNNRFFSRNIDYFIRNLERACGNGAT